MDELSKIVNEWIKSKYSRLLEIKPQLDKIISNKKGENQEVVFEYSLKAENQDPYKFTAKLVLDKGKIVKEEIIEA